MDETIERINTVIETYKLTRQAFADTCGFTSVNLLKILRGEQPVSDKVMSMIAEAFPQVSVGWLKTGEGEMLIEDRGTATVSEKTKERSYMSNNLQKLLFDFISVYEEQGRLLDKSMENTRHAMAQTDKAIENTNRMLAELSEQRRQMDRIISTLLNISPN